MVEDGGGAACNELTEFYRFGFPKVVGFVIALGVSPHGAHDIAQTAMVALVEQWSSIRNPYAWIHKVAYRLYQRAIQESKREDSSGIVPEHVCPWLSPEACAEATESAAVVERLLAVLPPQQRLVMASRMYGFTDDEIARSLGTTGVAVRQAAQRARDRLKRTVVARTSEVEQR